MIRALYAGRMGEASWRTGSHNSVYVQASSVPLVNKRASSRSRNTTNPLPDPLDRLIETKLEQWLVEHWDDIDFGQKLVIYTESGEAVGQQYDTGIVGRIDLLCEAEESNNLVVIELKRGRPSDEVVGQLARYIGWVKQNLANGREVNGIILAPEFDDRLRYAASAIPGTLLLRYQTRFEVHPD